MTLRFRAATRVQNVPEDLAYCEFECRRPRCDQSQWESCPGRLGAPNRYRGLPSRQSFAGDDD